MKVDKGRKWLGSCVLWPLACVTKGVGYIVRTGRMRGSYKDYLKTRARWFEHLPKVLETTILPIETMLLKIINELIRPFLISSWHYPSTIFSFLYYNTCCLPPSVWNDTDLGLLSTAGLLKYKYDLCCCFAPYSLAPVGCKRVLIILPLFLNSIKYLGVK